jgi:hypothetical protein
MNNKFKTKTWTNSNKMFINTGHKTFDKQTNVLFFGNGCANTMNSYSIRAYNNTVNPVGQYREPGFLQDFDMNNRNIPAVVKRFVKAVAIDKNVNLVNLFHFSNDKKVSHAWIVTESDGELITVFYDNYKQKTLDIVSECLPYFSYELD